MTSKKCPWCNKDIEVLFTEEGLIVCKIKKRRNENEYIKK